MFEVLNHYLPQIESSDILKRLKLKSSEYFGKCTQRRKHRI